MSHEKRVTQSLLLPDLRLVKEHRDKSTRVLICQKVSEFEVCPHCASKCSTIYDHVVVSIKDSPIRNKNVILKIRKRRFICKSCKKIFREPVNGIFKGFRTTQRLRRHLMWAASTYSDLSRVKSTVKCSNWLIYKAFYEQVELELRKIAKIWPTTIGIDEHSFVKNVRGNKRDFVTVFVDYNHRRIMEVAEGKAIGDLHHPRILNIKGKENVKNVIVDLSPTFKSYAKDYFPNAILIADRFHVVKLMHPLIQELKKQVLLNYDLNRGKGNPIGRMLITYRTKLRYHQKRVLDRFLELSLELKEVYWYQQRIYRLYRTKGVKVVRRKLIQLLDDMAQSKIAKIHSYRRTFRSWVEEIINYFKTRLTNGRTEGYNRKAKLIQRCAYGFRSFKNYRLKLLYLCR
jgi:transposase